MGTHTSKSRKSLVKYRGASRVEKLLAVFVKGGIGFVVFICLWIFWIKTKYPVGDFADNAELVIVLALAAFASDICGYAFVYVFMPAGRLAFPNGASHWIQRILTYVALAIITAFGLLWSLVNNKTLWGTSAGTLGGLLLAWFLVRGAVYVATFMFSRWAA